MEIRRLKQDLPEYTHEINQLMQQLSENYILQSEEDFLKLAQDNDLYVFGAFKDNELVGVASVFIRKNLYGWIAEIHDVVVSEECRGEGIGKKLTIALIDKTQEISNTVGKKISLSLTSNPSREAANAMYKKLGFNTRASANDETGTNLYRLVIKPNND